MIFYRNIPNQTILGGLVIYIICFAFLILLNAKKFNSFLLTLDLPQAEYLAPKIQWLAENLGLQTLEQAQTSFINQFLPQDQAPAQNSLPKAPVQTSLRPHSGQASAQLAPSLSHSSLPASLPSPKGSPTPSGLNPVDAALNELELAEQDRSKDSAIGNPSLTDAPPTLASPDSQKPKILIIGDSMIMEGFGPALYRKLKANKSWNVVKEGKYSTGLSRLDYFNWPNHLKTLMASHQPDLVIICLGANDPQDIIDAQSKRHHADSKSWQEIYQTRAEALIQIAAPAQVIWVGLPIMDKEPYASRIKRLSNSQAQACANSENAQFIDTTKVLTDAEGKFTSFAMDSNGKQIRLRYKDKIHVTETAGKLLSEFILPQIEAVFAKNQDITTQ